MLNGYVDGMSRKASSDSHHGFNDIIGVALLAAVFAATGSLGSPQAFSSGFTRAVIVAAALSFLGAVAGLALPRRRVNVAESAKRETAALREEALSR